MAAAWILSRLIHDYLLLACSTAICKLIGLMLSTAVIFMIMDSLLQSMRGSTSNIHLTEAFTIHTDPISTHRQRQQNLLIYIAVITGSLQHTSPKTFKCQQQTITSLTGAGRCSFHPMLQGIQLGNITLWVASAQTPLITDTEKR